MQGGPLGAFLGYLITGVLVSCAVISIAELSALVPLSGSIVRHAEYFLCVTKPITCSSPRLDSHILCQRPRSLVRARMESSLFQLRGTPS